MNKQALFGIGAALLMVLLTAAPAVYGTPGIAALLIGFGIGLVCDYDHGRGIFVQVKDYLFPPLPLFIEYIASQ